MLTAYLAGNGSSVLIPDAVDVVAGRTPDEVQFVDSQGRVLVVFKRADVSLYTDDGSKIPLPHASPSQTGGSGP